MNRKIQLSIACVVLTLLFALPLWGAHAPVYLSISDPELGSLVLKKEHPVKKNSGELGGLSLGHYTYGGETLQIQLYRGSLFPMDSPARVPELHYAHNIQMSSVTYDRARRYWESCGGEIDEGVPGPPPDWVFDETVGPSWERAKQIFRQMRALVVKHFDAYPDWQPELCELFGTSDPRNFEPSRSASRERQYTLGQLRLELYSARAFFEAPAEGGSSSSWFTHTATKLLQYQCTNGVWDFQKVAEYPNHGRYWYEKDMERYCTVDGVVAPIPARSQMNCRTQYGFCPGEHTCNDDAQVQLFYVNNGCPDNLKGGWCGDAVLNICHPFCLFSCTSYL